MEKQKLIFFTGAGISAESGIPTFGDQPGIRDKLTRYFATHNTDEYRKTIIEMRTTCQRAVPNAAHKAIATMDYPVITMNIDGLHQAAGSKNVIPIHGRLPVDDELCAENFSTMLNVPVLYGDPAPLYVEAKRLVKNLSYGDSYFIVVGTSFYTTFSQELLKIAKQKKSHIIRIDDNAAEKVPELIEKLKSLPDFVNKINELSEMETLD